MFIDREAVQAARVECFTGITHRVGEPRELAMRETVEIHGHQERGNLRVGDFVGGGQQDRFPAVRESDLLLAVQHDRVDEVLDFGLGELFAVPLLADDVDGMNSVAWHATSLRRTENCEMGETES